MSKQILVIDDDPAVSGAFKLILDDAGYRVRVAESGLQGIAMAQTERPDLIFLDLKMPGIDGVETLRRLKAIDATLNIYIVTAFFNEYMEQLKDAHNEGLQFQLANKPLSSEQIRQIAHSAVIAADNHKLLLTLYVVSVNASVNKLSDQITTILAALYPSGHWRFDVVEVLKNPEKALEKDVFATPMLVRDLPKPVLRLWGDFSKIPSMLAAITKLCSEHGSDEAASAVIPTPPGE